MPRSLRRLNSLAVKRSPKPGLLPDGGGLYLQVSSSGTKSWIYRFMLHRRMRDMGLGSLRDVGLAEARSEAARCRGLRARGIDPILERMERLGEVRAPEAGAITFDESAKRYIEAHKPSWKHSKHGSQWENTLVPSENDIRAY